MRNVQQVREGDSVAVGDFNGDGKFDLAVVNEFSNNVSILLGTGMGSFSTATERRQMRLCPGGLAADEDGGRWRE